MTIVAHRHTPAGLPPTRGPQPRRSSLWAPRRAVGVYLLTRIAQLAMLGNPVVTADTPMYRRPGQRWLDFGTTSLAGHSLRPWPVTVLYALAPNDTWRVIAQILIATGCWSFCIWQFARLLSNRFASLALGLAVAGLAGASGVSGFDPALLSESLTVSLVALFVGGLVSVGGGRGRLPTTAVTFVAASLLGVLRPVLIPLVAVSVVVAALAGWARRGRTGSALVPALVLAMLGVGTVAYAWNYNTQVDRTWGAWMGVPGLNGRTLTQYYLAAYTTPSGPRLIDAMVAAGAPACVRQAPPPDGGDPSIDHVRVDRLECPQGQAWLSERYIATLARHLLRHPTAAARYFGDALDDASVVSVQNAVGEQSLPSVVPRPVEELFFRRRGESGLDPLVMWTALAGVTLAVRASLGRRPEVTPTELMGHRALGWPIGVGLLVAYAALAGTALLSAADASRVALPVTVLLRLLLLAVVAGSTVAIVAAIRAAPAGGAAERETGGQLRRRRAGGGPSWRSARPPTPGSRRNPPGAATSWRSRRRSRHGRGPRPRGSRPA